MTLASGARLGAYEVVAPLGAGGMGEVYRASDTRLGREVALKVLPEAFARDAERMTRFEREARLLASLNHPHIAAIYGLEEIDGVRAIAMELVEGSDLAALIARGPAGASPRPGEGPATSGMPLDEALPLARQIADALEAAHEKGIIHRDLKPANVKVTPDGTVKVLDFGLAKALAAEAESATADNSPTISAIATRAGVILGTAAYMSPEQARGKPLDRRTDIWSFGCLLFEMLSGRMAFRGDTVSDTIARILEREPEWQALPETTPPGVRRLLGRCLQKDPKRRMRDIADARLDIEEALAGPASSALEASPDAAPAPTPARWRASAVWMIATGALAAVAALAFWLGLRESTASPQPVRWLQVPAPFLTLARGGTIDISRDGSRLVYVGEQNGTRQLYLRPLDSREPKPIPGTENALCPFFSPDGLSVGFWADRKLKKVSLSGGLTPLCDAPLNLSALPLKASWGTDGWILHGGIEARGVVERVRDAGGAPERLIRADPKTEWYLHQPEMLPDGDHVLMTAQLPTLRVLVQSLRTGKRQTLVEDAYGAHYSATGHLVYMQADKIAAVPFDLKGLAKTGTPVVMVDGVSGGPFGAGYSLSDNGTLAFLPARQSGDPRNTFVWVDREGHEQPVAAVRGFFGGAQLSPDGKKAATWCEGDQVCVLNIERGGLTRVTTEGKNAWFLWSVDGRRLVFNSLRPESSGTSLFWQVEDGSAPADRLTTTDLMQQPRSFTPDGSLLVFQELHPETGYDIWTLAMTKGAKPTELLRTKFNEFQPKLSPDGKWMAYVSDESGRDEVWVRAFPSMGQRTQISTDGGGEPAWSREGRELFYVTSDNPNAGCRVMAVNVRTAPTLEADTPRKLFEGPYSVAPVFGRNYDVSGDGKRFLMVKFEPEKPPAAITVVLNWFEELKRKLAAPGK
jgi:Tol biopolymer transport system component